MNEYDEFDESYAISVDDWISTNKGNRTTKVKTQPKADTIHMHEDQDYIDSLSGLNRIALVAIIELVSHGKADFLFLRDETIKAFWEKHLVKIEASRIYRQKKKREEEMRNAALAKLTTEEKRLLGIIP